jgi:hypothetical protein
MLEETDSRRRCKLCGMVKLQARVSELGRFLGSNRLPHPWGWAPSFARFVRNQFHKYPVKNNTSRIRHSSHGHKRTNR